MHGSRYENSPLLYKENGFKEKADAIHLIEEILEIPRDSAVFDLPKNVAAEQNDAIRQQNSREILSCEKDGVIHKIEKKKEKKNPPLLYNLAELQNDCSKFFKISPDETLAVVQELYEKKLVTYPRTDARVLSAAVAKEITKTFPGCRLFRECGRLPKRFLRRNAIGDLKRLAMSMTSRSQIIMPLFPPVRGYII